MFTNSMHFFNEIKPNEVYMAANSDLFQSLSCICTFGREKQLFQPNLKLYFQTSELFASVNTLHWFDIYIFAMITSQQYSTTFLTWKSSALFLQKCDFC